MGNFERFAPRPLTWTSAADIHLRSGEEEIVTMTAPAGGPTRESKAAAGDDLYRFYRDENLGGTLGLQRFYLSDIRSQLGIFETRPGEVTGRLRLRSGEEMFWDRFGSRKFYWKIGRKKVVTYDLQKKEIRIEVPPGGVDELEIIVIFGLYLIHTLTI